MPSIEGLGSRRAALSLLDSVLRRGQTLDSAAARLKGLSPPDHGLALAIAGETLRRLPDLDAMIDSVTRQRLPDDSKARMVLRIALAQKIGLDTPDHALVATALPLVEGGPRRLVHGVLGTLLRNGISINEAPHLPIEVESRWSAAWGDEAVAAARHQIALRPPLDLSFKDEAAATSFAADNDGVSLARRHVRLNSQSVEQLPHFDQGLFWIQDLAASLPARLIPSDAGSVIDLCAAPGGKTMQLAASGHDVIAVDRDARRLDRLRANLDRTRLGATVVTADALEWNPNASADAILLDAPCSSTGTFRRHPEVLFRARRDVIAANITLQRALLDRAASWLPPGGTLVYAVCSLEPEEGEEQVKAFLIRHRGFRLRPPTMADLPPGVSAKDDGTVRVLPTMLTHVGGLDGFFIARLVRDA